MRQGAGLSNKTRALSAYGYDGGSPGYQAVVQYAEFATQGNFADFGDSSQGAEGSAGLANNTRGVFAIGYGQPAGASSSDTVEYVTINTLGNVADFGNLTQGRWTLAALSSNTRGVFAGGASPSTENIIDYITISTVGNATDFGDLTVARKNALSSSNSTTRGVFAGGYGGSPAAISNVIDYITIATTGDATDFGDLTTAKQNIHTSVASNTTKGLFAGGATPSNLNSIDQITIASTANATDFGDLIVTTNNMSAMSNGHGGLIGG